MLNQCKCHIRKSDAKNTETHPTWSPKGSQKPSKNLSKICSNKNIGKRWFVTLHPGSPGIPLSPTYLRRRHPEDTQNLRRKTTCMKDTYRHPAERQHSKTFREESTFEDKPHLSNTPRAPTGPGADILDPMAPRGWGLKRSPLTLSARLEIISCFVPNLLIGW